MEGVLMSRATVEAECRETLGLVPKFIAELPDYLVESEWQSFKAIEFGETAIPNKYKELIGLAVSAVTRCRYCALFHTEAAKLFGATEAEIEEAVHYTKLVSGWSVYINGLQVDYDAFADEVHRVVDYITSQKAAA